MYKNNNKSVVSNLDVIKIVDGIVVRENVNLSLSQANNKYSKELSNGHLCWQFCKNARADKCRKIIDEPKREIQDYPFIEEGYQIYTGDGELQNFCISKCSNYEKNPAKVKVKKK